MSYSMMGATGADSFKMVGGIAKSVDEATMINFKKLQLQLARFEPLKIDGAIGPTTVRLYDKYSGRRQGVTAEGLALSIVPSTSWMMGAADVKGRPPAGPVPPTRVRTVQTPKGDVLEETNPQGEDSLIDTAMNFVASPMGLVAGAAVVGLFLFTRRKRGSATPVATPVVAAPAVP